MSRLSGSADLPQRVLLTGGNGYIGRWVLRSLDRLLPESRVRILVRSPRQLRDASRVEVFRGDLTDPSSIAGFAADSQVLLHCASYVGGSTALSESINERGTEGLLHQAQRAGVDKIVYVSTASVYGRGPFVNATPYTLDVAPISPASKSRAVAENLVLAAGGTVLRPYLVYGAGDRWVGPRLAALGRVLGPRVAGCRARISMVDVRRLSDATVTAASMLDPVRGGRLYNCNHPNPVMARSCIAAFMSMLPDDRKKLEAHESSPSERATSAHDEAMVSVDHWFDSAQVWKDCGISPGHRFETAVVDHKDWYHRQAAEGA